MSAAPPLPKIEGDVDLMLDVYTHHTLRFGTAPLNDDYGDTQRLAELGAKVLDLVVTYHLFSEKPDMLTQEQIKEKRERLLSHENINVWLDVYGLKSKLRAAPSEINALLNDPVEMTTYFHIYIGALYIRNGLPTIQKWISALIDPEADVKPPGGQPSADGGYYQPMPPHYSMQSSHSSNYSPGNSQTPYSQQTYTPQPTQGYAPAPPSTAPPPLPNSPPAFNYSPSSPLSLVTLALVNQTASQQGIQVTYPAEQVGPSHLPTWTVRCCMNGVERGRGVGKSQKLAKEEAARQAWASMAWGPTS